MLVGLGFFLCAMPHFFYRAPDQFSIDLAVVDSTADQTTTQQDSVYQVRMGTSERIGLQISLTELFDSTETPTLQTNKIAYYESRTRQ